MVSNLKNNVRRNGLVLFVSSLFLVILNILWFNKFEFNVLMGDDLNAWKIFSEISGFLNYSFGSVSFNKYRPVFNVVQYILFDSFGHNYSAFKLINLLMNSSISILLFFVFRSMIEENKMSKIIFPFLFSCLYITSRFSYYSVLQMYGLMEALCLLFLILIITFLMYYDKSKKETYLHLVLLLNLLIVFTHERYMVLFPALILIFYFFEITKKKKNLYICLLIFPSILNFLIKKIWFASTFLEGTGGATLEFDIIQMIRFFFSALFNIFGFNIGQSYLSGLNFFESSLYAQVISFVIFISLAILVFFFVRQSVFNKRFIAVCMTNLVLLSSLLLVASVTIRQEFRWLYAPYVILLIFIFYMLKDSWNKKISIVIMVFIISTLLSNIYYSKYQYNVFFVNAQIIAESANDETFKKYGEDIKNKSVYIEKNDVALNWTLLDSLFFQVYANMPEFKVNYYNDISEINTDMLDKNSTLIYSFESSTKKFVNITKDVFSNNRKVKDINVESGNWSTPDDNYPSHTQNGEKLYYILVDNEINRFNATLIRLDINQNYILSKTSQNNETINLLEPNEYALYKANDDYNFLWISVPEKVTWNSRIQYYTRE